MVLIKHDFLYKLQASGVGQLTQQHRCTSLSHPDVHTYCEIYLRNPDFGTPGIPVFGASDFWVLNIEIWLSLPCCWLCKTSSLEITQGLNKCSSTGSWHECTLTSWPRAKYAHSLTLLNVSAFSHWPHYSAFSHWPHYYPSCLLSLKTVSFLCSLLDFHALRAYLVYSK